MTAVEAKDSQIFLNGFGLRIVVAALVIALFWKPFFKQFIEWLWYHMGRPLRRIWGSLVTYDVEQCAEVRMHLQAIFCGEGSDLGEENCYGFIEQYLRREGIRDNGRLISDSASLKTFIESVVPAPDRKKYASQTANGKGFWDPVRTYNWSPIIEKTKRARLQCMELIQTFGPSRTRNIFNREMKTHFKPYYKAIFKDIKGTDDAPVPDYVTGIEEQNLHNIREQTYVFTTVENPGEFNNVNFVQIKDSNSCAQFLLVATPKEPVKAWFRHRVIDFFLLPFIDIQNTTSQEEINYHVQMAEHERVVKKWIWKIVGLSAVAAGALVLLFVNHRSRILGYSHSYMCEGQDRTENNVSYYYPVLLKSLSLLVVMFFSCILIVVVLPIAFLNHMLLQMTFWQKMRWDVRKFMWITVFTAVIISQIYWYFEKSISTMDFGVFAGFRWMGDQIIARITSINPMDVWTWIGAAFWFLLIGTLFTLMLRFEKAFLFLVSWFVSILSLIWLEFWFTNASPNSAISSLIRWKIFVKSPITRIVCYSAFFAVFWYCGYRLLTKHELLNLNIRDSEEFKTEMSVVPQFPITLRTFWKGYILSGFLTVCTTIFVSSRSNTDASQRITELDNIWEHPEGRVPANEKKSVYYQFPDSRTATGLGWEVGTNWATFWHMISGLRMCQPDPKSGSVFEFTRIFTSLVGFE